MNKNNWEKLLTREGVDITTISGIDKVFYKRIWEYSGGRNELFFTHFSDKTFTHYIGVNPQELGRSLYKKYFFESGQIKDYYKKGEELTEKIRKTTEKYKELLNTSNSTKCFLDAFREFKDQFEKINYIYSITPWLAINAWQEDMNDILSAVIDKNRINESERKKIINSIYQPWEKTALRKAKEKLKKGEEVEKLVNEFQFLRSWSVVWYRPIDKEWVRNLNTKQNKEDSEALSLNNIIERLDITEEEEHFMRLSPYIVFFKDYRDDLRRYHCYRWNFLFEYLSDHFDTKYDNWGYLTLEEIEDVIESGSLDNKIISDRKSNPCIITSRQENLIMYVRIGISNKYKEIIDKVEQGKASEEIKGLVAQKGKARGKVKIVQSYHDIKNVKEGNILVANTTHPNYASGMKKAIAFVTNEGGIVSHAAILAREMEKPCIVGTRNATKALNDGDRVEVDANKGVVKIIKSKINYA